MDKKDDILEAWIMVEHLTEGDVKDKNLKKIEVPIDNDYYSMLYTEIQSEKFKKNQKGGLALYFNIFSFDEVIRLLREKYALPTLDEEISVGDKFSFAIYFDKDLKLMEEMTFFTESYYILKKRCVPKEKDFLKFEKENKENIEDYFSCSSDEEYRDFFNKAFAKLIEKYAVQIRNCRMKVVSNLETDEANLHSFFAADLEKAKYINTQNLDAYILGEKGKRINLDSRKTSENFNPKIFKDILQPQNYPIARFPSNPKYALSMMQQIAVNLAIGYGDEKIRSVNGPPGTGKTTLLKDIFAELVVEQAHEITILKDKVISKRDKLQYFENAYIGKMPETLAEKGIVVASSNNGAVQNIVNELPLISAIDDSFVEDIKNADYFRNISNSKISTVWEVDEQGKKIEKLICEPSDEKFWGLFSMEGGKKANMDFIITTLKHVVNYLENEYESNAEVYDDFMKNYREVYEYKKDRQTIAKKYSRLGVLRDQLESKQKKYEVTREKSENELNILAEKCFSDSIELKQKLVQIDEQTEICICDIEDNSNEKDVVIQAIEVLKLQKPCLFAGIKKRRNYKERMYSLSEQLLALLETEKTLNLKKSNLEKEKNNIIWQLEENEKKLRDETKKNEEKNQSVLNEIRKLEKEIQNQELILQELPIDEFDMDVDYESLQVCNPWFDDKYRVLQSKLFINALKVRKQFLYENRKSLKAAYIIWNKQKEYIEKKQLIVEAWNWINMVIPVISSTFASFSRMCTNLDKESIGYLFVDEAGQALPQASVGAIFRSKQVMVVGDPAQIKPVMTLDSSILSMLGEHYKVSNKYLSDSASTQTLVDDISKYGFYKTPEEWIGIPLWVHRRCKNPMFNISNTISYGGNMVQSTAELGKAGWYHVTGSAYEKYVEEQGDFLKEKILKLIEKNPDVINKTKKDIVYVISPFKNVAYQLSQKLKEIEFTRYDNGKPTNVGTVHTFQGKEAPIVFFVLGCDENNRGAASWAVGSDNPNIMNVAATRAKDEFYIIGDKKLFMSIRSDVINETYKILKDFNSQRFQ